MSTSPQTKVTKGPSKTKEDVFLAVDGATKQKKRSEKRKATKDADVSIVQDNAISVNPKDANRIATSFYNSMEAKLVDPEKLVKLIALELQLEAEKAKTIRILEAEHRKTSALELTVQNAKLKLLQQEAEPAVMESRKLKFESPRLELELFEMQMAAQDANL